MREGEKFTDKERLFVARYLEHLNATKAAKLAGYSPKTAHVIGHELLRKPKIRAELDRIMNDAGMSAEEVMYRMSEIASADMSEYLRQSRTGKITLDVKALQADGRGFLIKKIANTANGPTIEFHDAKSALESLIRIHGMITERVEVITWQDRAIADIRAGVLDYSDLAREFDDSLARELFEQAGVPITVNQENE